VIKMYKVLVGKTEGKRPFGRTRHRQDGIRMDFGAICWGGGMEWLRLAQVRDWWPASMNTVMKL
jgi:hypothetical protein